MKTLILFITIIFLSATHISAQDNSVNSLMLEGKKAVEHGTNQFDKQQLLKAHSIFERILSLQPENNLALYYLTYSEYNLLSYGLNRPEKPLYENFIDKAIDNGKKLSEKKEFKAEGSVILASIYMMKISNSTIEAAVLVPRLHGLLDDAQKADSACPRSYLIRGIMKYNTPEFFGGSKEDAIKNYKHAINLYKHVNSNDSLRIDWGYAEAYAWLGIAQKDLNNKEEAKQSFNKALEIAPDYSWVKYVLLPGLDKEEQTSAK
jgi:tetratricopeptide (TPR) repeat protein